MRRSLFFSICVLLFPLASAQANPLDYNEDGYSDIVFMKKSKKNATWSYFSPQTGQSGGLGFFGKYKAIPAPGFWNSQEAPSLVSVERVGKKKKSKLFWTFQTSNGGSRLIEFGSGAEEPLVGGDFNGNGYLDAAVVSKDGSFRVLTDPFAPAQDTSVQSVIFAENFSVTKKKKQPFPFFQRTASGSSVPASFTSVTVGGIPRYQLQSRSENGLLTSFIPGVASRSPESVLTLLDAEGNEYLLISGKQEFLAEKDKRRVELSVLSENGITIFRRKFSKRGTVLVGDFIDEAGEEIAVVTKKTILIVNPFTGAQRSLTGTAGKAAGPFYVPQKNSSEEEDNLGPCDEFLPAPDGLRGFLAKNSDHGGVVYLTPNGSYSNGRILHPKSLKEISGTRYTGVANGGRGHFRIGGSLPFGEHVFSAETGGKTHCWRIPDGMSRVD